MKNTLPVILLKNLLILPNQEVKLELNNNLSKEVVYLSSNNYHNEVIVISPKDQMEEIPEVSDLPKMAVIAKIKSKIELPNGNLRVTLRGLFRAEIKDFKNDSNNDILICKYKKGEIPAFKEIEAIAVKRKLNNLVSAYVKNGQGVSNSILNVIKGVEDLNKLTDLIAAFLPISFVKRLSYIEEMNPVIRGNNLIEDLSVELEVIKLEEKLDQKLQNGLEESQKEFILKEKLRAIEEELGEFDEKEKELSIYEKKLEDGNFPSNVMEKIKSELKMFSYTNEASPELSNIRNYLDWMFSLPWNNSSIDEANIKNIKKCLDSSHYGMEKAKEKVIEYIAAKRQNQDIDVPILCLVGPAGVGKTTFAKSIADALKKKFYKISVGGLNDSAVLNGHRRTYLGANPGKIIEALKKCGTNNPVILIDEVDKMVRDYKGDPASVLLDILDKSQNKVFTDNYISEEFDLSKIFFILTANYVEDIPYELYDRLEVVNISNYTCFEKIKIAREYLLPNIYKNNVLNAKNIRFSDEVLKEIIEDYTKEAGVRELERVLTQIVRKLLVLGRKENVKITHELLHELLGEGKYTHDVINEENIPGVINALAVNQYGGVVMPIETTLYDAHTQIKITGMVEQVMQESVNVAISYLLANRDFFKISPVALKNKCLHIHFLEAAVKKDGPSAGVSIMTSLLSLIKKVPISSHIAMTGEITLNGYVCKIGGLKNKLIGAYNANIDMVFIPKANHYDLEEVPKEIKDKIKIIEVENYKEIYNELFKDKK